MLLNEGDNRRYLDCRFRTQLDRMGVPTNCAGYDYLMMALYIVWDMGALLGIRLIDDIYNSIANECGLSISNVERCMRQAIDAAWESSAEVISREMYTQRKPGILQFIIQNVCMVQYL